MFDINYWLKQAPHISFGPEVLFIILGAIFILLWGLSLGRTRALVSLLSIYIAYVLMISFPYLSYVNRALNLKYDIEYVKVGLFFAVYIVVFGIFNKSLVKVRLSMKETSTVTVGIISLLQLCLLVSIVVNITQSIFLDRIPDYLAPFFLGQQALFTWFVLPILVILFIKKD